MGNDLQAAIRDFLAQRPFAVVGASGDRSKYGNRVLRHYLERGLPVHAVNPAAAARGEGIEGQPAWPSLALLPEPVAAVSFVTPPAVTEQVVDEALRLGIEHLWMQPGAESASAIERARAQGLTVIHGGPCVLVELG